MIASLQTRLLLAVGLLALAAVAAVALAVRQGTRQEFLRLQDIERRAAMASGADRARELARQVDGHCCEGATLDAAAATLGSTLAVLVTDDRAGRLVAFAGQPMRGLSDVTTRREGPLVTIEATRRAGGVVNRIALKVGQEGVPVHLAGGAIARLYVIPFPSEEAEQQTAAFLGSFDRRLLVATSVVGILALAITWTLARRTVRPIAELRAAAHDVGGGDLTRRVTPRGQDEVAELGRSFNAMAGELERQQVLRRSLIHDVTHELRAPLTALRCRLETVVDGLAADPARALADVRDEVLHLGRLVDDLQELALAEARELRLDLDDVPLADVVESAARAAGLDRDSRLQVDIPDGLAVRGDGIRVRQILLNLLTNADRHTPPGESIVVRGTLDDEGVCVDVENTGSCLDGEQLARVFDRFYRTDPSRQRATGGTGLGLAIVKHLAEAQGGRVWARSSPSSVTVGFGLRRAR